MLRSLKNKGFTLVELMIALSLNGLLIVALIAIFVAGVIHYNSMFKTNLLFTQLQAAMDIMVTDIRRAGYWSLARNMLGSHANTNPFMASGTDVTITGGNCILFTYDRTGAGSLPAISTSYDDLRYGYRVNGGALQSRPTGASFACNAATPAWTNLTDPTSVTINNLNFTLTSQVLSIGSHSITVRNVTITLTGTLVSDTNLTQTLVETVRIANDKYT